MLYRLPSKIKDTIMSILLSLFWISFITFCICIVIDNIVAFKISGIICGIIFLLLVIFLFIINPVKRNNNINTNVVSRISIDNSIGNQMIEIPRVQELQELQEVTEGREIHTYHEDNDKDSDEITLC